MIESFKDGLADPLIMLDQLLGDLSAYFVFTRDSVLSLGFTLAVRGGYIGGATYADFTTTLAASSTTYVEADTTAHTISANTTGYTSGRTPIGIAATNGTGLTSWLQDFAR